MRYLKAASILFCFSTLTLHGMAAELDTLTAQERTAIAEAQKNSSFGYVSQVRNYSLRGDTIRASEYLLKINPYYFLREWDNSTRPDTFLKS